MKHLGIVSQPQDLVTLEVLRTLSTKWSFGGGPPSDAAGVLGEHYVEANNRVWIKTAPDWIYTGIQFGSSANVQDKATLVDADVISIGDSANSLQMRRVTISDFKTQFLAAALTDAPAGPDLPAAGILLGWTAIVQTLRNGLKWVTSRFNGSGQLSVAFGGTGTDNLANLPVSDATASALAQKVDKSFRLAQAAVATGNFASWRSVGVISLGQADVACITLYGTNGYGDNDECSGATIIHLRGTNNALNHGIEGHFWGVSKGNSTISAVAVDRISVNQWRIYVLPYTYTTIASVCDTSGAFLPESLDTGSDVQPAGSRLIDSANWWMVAGQKAMGLTQSGLVVTNRDVFLTGSNSMTFGPNVGWGASLRFGGDPRFIAPGVVGTAAITNGNFHLDSADGDYRLYFNFYRGRGVIFGDGQTNTVAEVTATGEWNGTNVHARQDNAYEIGSTNARFAVAYFGSNPIVTSDRRWKTDLGTTLGLDFVLALRPQSYRLMDAKVTVITEPDGYEDVQEQLYETRQVVGTEIVVVGGKPVRKTVEREEHVPVFDLLPVTDEHGEAVLDEGGQPVMHPVPRMRTVRRGKTRQVRSVSEGVRRHHGLLAQQVLEVLQAQGLTSLDFAGLIRDEEADTWGLRYEQFIAPLIESIQSLYRKLDASEAERIRLIGQVAQLQNTVECLLLNSGGAAPQ